MPNVPERFAERLDLDEPTPNGHPPKAGSFDAKLIADLDGAIREHRDALVKAEADVEQARERAADARSTVKRYETIRRQLLGEPAPGRKPGPKPSVDRAARGTVVGPDRLEAVKRDILRYVADRDVDEFAQVDIRSMPEAAMPSSGGMASAFETLRQDGFIRLARKEGNRKVYRLTAAGMAAAEK